LLDINAFAVNIPGTEDQSTRRAQWGNFVSFARAMETQDKLVNPNPLGIVRGPVAREVTLEMVHRLSPVRLYWQVTAGAGGRPREMAGEAFHALLGMGQGICLGWRTAPGFAILLHGLGKAGFLIVMPRAWINTIQHLHDFPFQIFRDIGAL
jgi:hypothetical protein